MISIVLTFISCKDRRDSSMQSLVSDDGEFQFLKPIVVFFVDYPQKQFRDNEPRKKGAFLAIQNKT